MENIQCERKPIFIAHNVIAIIDIYEPCENDCLSLCKWVYDDEDAPIDFKKAAEEVINHFRGRECIAFINDLMVTCAEYIMKDWKERSPDERLPEYKKSLVEDIKKVVKDY